MGTQVDDVKKANQELKKAQTITGKRNKNMCVWIIFVLVLALILVASIYFLFFPKDDK